jgi:hypothetical protein
LIRCRLMELWYVVRDIKTEALDKYIISVCKLHFAGKSGNFASFSSNSRYRHRT